MKHGLDVLLLFTAVFKTGCSQHAACVILYIEEPSLEETERTQIWRLKTEQSGIRRSVT